MDGDGSAPLGAAGEMTLSELAALGMGGLGDEADFLAAAAAAQEAAAGPTANELGPDVAAGDNGEIWDGVEQLLSRPPPSLKTVAKASKKKAATRKAVARGTSGAGAPLPRVSRGANQRADIDEGLLNEAFAYAARVEAQQQQRPGGGKKKAAAAKPATSYDLRGGLAPTEGAGPPRRRVRSAKARKGSAGGTYGAMPPAPPRAPRAPRGTGRSGGGGGGGAPRRRKSKARPAAQDMSFTAPAAASSAASAADMEAMARDLAAGSAVQRLRQELAASARSYDQSNQYLAQAAQEWAPSS